MEKTHKKRKHVYKFNTIVWFVWWFAASLPEAFQRLSQKKGSRRSHVQTMNLGPKQEVYKRFMIFHDISWYFMKFMQSSGHFMAISTPQGYTHWLCTDRDWGAYHSIQHVLPHHFAKHGICPKTKDQVIVQRRGVLLHQLFLQHHLSIVAAHLLAPFQQVAALILAATMPWSRCPTRIRGAPTADNSGSQP